LIIVSTCKNCNKRFKVADNIRNVYFCSKKCKRAYEKKNKKLKLGVFADYGKLYRKNNKNVWLNYPLHFIFSTDCRKHNKKNKWKTYDEYLLSSTWKKIRKKILKRDDYKCQICGKPANEVHHKRYRKWGEENEDDLIAICKTCHEAKHKEKKKKPRNNARRIKTNLTKEQILNKEYKVVK